MPGLEAPTIENIIMAVVMVICVIIFIVGINIFAAGGYATGAITTLLGLGGISGVMYWIRHSTMHQVKYV